MSKKSKIKTITDKLISQKDIDLDDLKYLLSLSEKEREYLANAAREASLETFGNKIYLRGLIEFSSYCKNNCLYCGIRNGNQNAERYRLSKEQILSCCEIGHKLGFRTFVLQGGEDPHYTDPLMCSIVSEIRASFPDCAITLSLGERSYESYQRLFDAGADRYLLRHETADNTHYAKLHPAEMSLKNRKECLFNLKKIGYQTGCGIMVGSPHQTAETIYSDLMFMKELKPQMIGIGPFISHKDTPFKNYPNGSADMTLTLLSVLRLMFPKVLLPATTALGTLDPLGREKGILAGANVLMPNLSPVSVRKKYSLYDNKICMGEEAAECNLCLRGRINRIGYEVADCRGDYGVKY